VQLYAAGSSGYGSPANSLIPSGSYYLGGASGCVPTGSQTCYANIISDANGNFTISNDYSCTSVTTPVYLVATGGNSGSGTNPNLTLMTALGSCSQLQSTSYVSINELTTVASVWALSPFMTGPTNLGTSSTNAQGLLNAFAAVNKVVNTSSGTLPGTALPTNATLPITKLNTLADILAACINSIGGVANDTSNCGTLFQAAKVGTNAPTDTVTAAVNIAQHPGSNVSTLYGLASATAPFQPILPTTSIPTDWTIAINYTGGGLSTPKGVAVDASGNVWLPNYGNSSVTKLSNTGAAISGGNGYTVGSVNLPVAIAVDTSGNAWVANSSTVTEISPSGSTGTLYSGTSLSAPKSLAVDGVGDIWVANGGSSSVTEITIGGSLVKYTGAGVASPAAIAISPK
jgi:hypothetical protein